MVHIGVIGTGTMGSNHIRVLSEMKGVDVSISDIDREKCKKTAESFGVSSYFFDHNEMLKQKLDGVIIAVPSNFHKSVFLDCIKHETALFVEKPIAENLNDAMTMMEKARQRNILFTVGHIERFNPVVTKLKSLLSTIGDVYLVNTIRAGPFPKRFYGSRGGVLLDLAVHDIDVISYLIGDINEVYSHIIKSGRQEIFANALFRINKNICGSSEFSWVSPRRVRTVEIYGTHGMLSGDYHQQTLSMYDNPDGDIPHSSNLFKEVLLKGNIGAGKVTEYKILKDEPLKLEIQNFIDSINNKTEPLVKPEEAIRALRVALSLLESSKQNRSIRVD